MDEQVFRKRTKQLGLRVIRLVEALPANQVSKIISHQILRSATSIGANYRVACRSKSTKDMIAKLSIVEEEADETLYWLELLVEANIFPHNKLADLMQETDEIVAMTVSSIKTLRQQVSNPKSKM